jgi:hypothetical protein
VGLSCISSRKPCFKQDVIFVSKMGKIYHLYLFIAILKQWNFQSTDQSLLTAIPKNSVFGSSSTRGHTIGKELQSYELWFYTETGQLPSFL